MNPSIKTLLFYFFYLLFPFSIIIGSAKEKKTCKIPREAFLSSGSTTESTKKSVESAKESEISIIAAPPGLLISLGLLKQIEAVRLIHEKGDSRKIHSSNNSAVILFQAYIDCLKENNITPGQYSLLFKSLSLFDMDALKESNESLDEAIKIDPNFRDAYLLKSRILIRQAKYVAAADFLEKNINKFPEDSDFLFLLGSLNMELGNNSRAILYFVSLFDSIKNKEGDLKYRSHVLKNLGELYYRTGDNRKSIFYFQRYLQYEDSVMEKIKLAKLYSLLGNFSGAKNELNSIQENYPGRKDVIELLGEIIFIENRYEAYLYLNKNHEKIRENSLAYLLYQFLNGNVSTVSGKIKKFILNNPERLAAKLALLSILEKEGEAEASVADKLHHWEEFSEEVKKTSEIAYQYKQYFLAANLAEKLIQLSVSHPLIHARIYDFIATCYEYADSPNRSILYVKKAIEAANNQDDKEKFILHLAYLNRNPIIAKYREAILLTNAVITKKNHSSYAWFLKGIVYIEMKNYAESLKSIEKAIEYESKNPTYYFYQAISLEALGKQEGTILALRNAINFNRSYSTAYNYLGYFMLTQGKNIEESLTLIKKAVELEPDNASFQDSLGWAYFKLNQFNLAKYHLGLALQLMTESGEIDPVVLDHLGDLYLQKNDLVNANEYWEKSIKLQKEEKEKEKIRLKIESIKNISMNNMND